MAVYCVAEDVQVLLGMDGNYSSTTNPTLAQVNTIISDISKELDFYLTGAGVSLPISDTTILGRLRLACKYGVASEVGFSAFGNAKGTDGSQPDKYEKKYQDILKEIQDTPERYGAVLGNESMHMSNPVLDGSYTEQEIVDGFPDRNPDY